MVKWRIDTKSQPKLVGYYMHARPALSQGYRAIICSLRVKRSTFFYQKKEIDATFWVLFTKI